MIHQKNINTNNYNSVIAQNTIKNINSHHNFNTNNNHNTHINNLASISSLSSLSSLSSSNPSITAFKNNINNNGFQHNYNYNTVSKSPLRNQSKNIHNSNNIQHNHYGPLNQIPITVNTPVKHSKNSPSPFKNNTHFNNQESSNCRRKSINIKNNTNNNHNHNSAKKNRLSFTINNMASQYQNQNNSYLCQNHNAKQAKFNVQIQQQTIYYCQKCAISLASQGFKVNKLNFYSQQTQNQYFSSAKKQQQSFEQKNKSIIIKRKSQIVDFLKQLERTTFEMKTNKEKISQFIQFASSQHKNTIEKVENYYEHFFNVLKQHKNGIISSIKYDYETKTKQIQSFLDFSIQNNIKQALSMKNDIQLSLDTVIPQAEQSQYEAVIGLYRQKLNKFKQAEKIQFGDIYKHQTNYQTGGIKLLSVQFEDPSQLVSIIDQQLDSYVRIQNNLKQTQNLSSKFDLGKVPRNQLNTSESSNSFHKGLIYNSHSKTSLIIEQVQQQNNNATAKNSTIINYQSNVLQLEQSPKIETRLQRLSKSGLYHKMQQKIQGIQIGQSRIIDQQQLRNEQQIQKYELIKKVKQENVRQFTISQRKDNQKKLQQNNKKLKQLSCLFSSLQSHS